MIYMVLAMDLNHLIGAKNMLPWHYPKDLKRYNEICKDKDVLMGYNTYLSLTKEYKIKNFNYNKIFVVSENKIDANKVETIKDPINFLKEYKNDLYIIGGKSIYELLLKYTDYIYLTYILDIKSGDVYLNNFLLDDFEVVKKEKDEDLLFVDYRRKK